MYLVWADKRCIIGKAENEVEAGKATGTVLRLVITEDNLRILMFIEVLSHCPLEQ